MFLDVDIFFFSSFILLHVFDIPSLKKYPVSFPSNRVDCSPEAPNSSCWHDRISQLYSNSTVEFSSTRISWKTPSREFMSENLLFMLQNLSSQLAFDNYCNGYFHILTAGENRKRKNAYDFAKQKETLLLYTKTNLLQLWCNFRLLFADAA